MISQGDRIELERALEEGLESIPESNPPVYCQQCQKLISVKPDEHTRTICSACSQKPILGKWTVDESGQQKGLLPREFTEKRTALLRAFNSAVEGVLGELHEILRLDESGAEIELRATSIWKEIGGWGCYMDCSEEHNELVSTLLQVVCSELKQEFSHEKAQALRDALELLQGQFILSDSQLDRVYEALRQGRFDINYSMSFLQS